MHLLTLLLGFGFLQYQTVTIVASGALLLVIGIVICFLAVRTSDRSSGYLGASSIVLCVVVVSLINIFSWSPESATKPVTMISLAYAILAVPLALYIGFRTDNGFTSDHNET